MIYITACIFFLKSKQTKSQLNVLFLKDAYKKLLVVAANSVLDRRGLVTPAHQISEQD